MGQLYLTNVDFLKNGVPASIIAALVRPFLAMVLDIQHTNRIVLCQVVASLGYALMKLVGCVYFFFTPFCPTWLRSCSCCVQSKLTQVYEGYVSLNIPGCQHRPPPSNLLGPC